MLKTLVACLLVLLSASLVMGQQSSDDLKKKQSEIQQEIDDLKRTLDDTKKNKKAGLSQLALVSKKLRLREQAINNINDQIENIQGTIGQSRNEISRLKKELDTLKSQYGKSIVYAYRNRSNYEFLNFIFSATSFNDALKRIEYLKSYRLYRQEQAATIRNTQALLQGKITGLESTRKQKDEVLQKQEKEKLVLVDERKEKDEIVSKLKAREREISKELTAKAKADIKLRSAIRAAINKEIKAANDRRIAEEKAEREREKERLKNAAAAKPETNNATATAPKKAPEKAAPRKSVLETTPEVTALSGKFENNKGRLPWPVEKGIITLHFGRYSIEGTALTGNNPGITLTTEKGAAVKSIFEGEVRNISDIEGNWMVIVKHGKYYSVYSNLSSVSVSKGQQVSMGQMLGRAAVNEDNEGDGQVEFIIMEEQRNLDPEKWIKR